MGKLSQASINEHAQKITKAVAKILHAAGLKFAILGTEEACTGDPAKHAEQFLFQMMAMQNITTLNAYGVKKIVTACPHCFNTLKNEYPSLGGDLQRYCTIQRLLTNCSTKAK